MPAGGESGDLANPLPPLLFQLLRIKEGEFTGEAAAGQVSSSVAPFVSWLNNCICFTRSSAAFLTELQPTSVRETGLAKTRHR